MTPEQKQLVHRHLRDEGAPLSGDEYRRLRREMAADAELTRYFNELGESRVDAAGEPVMSARQLQSIVDAADGGTSGRRWLSSPWRLGVIAAAAGAVAVVAVAASRNGDGVVFRGGSPAEALPSFRCEQGAPAASCPAEASLHLPGPLFPRGVDRGHLAVVTCDARFSCAVVQRRERGRDERAVVLGPGLPRPLRVYAVWTAEALTPARLAQAAEQLGQSGGDLPGSALLPLGRALQSSAYLGP